ncbi:MAG: ABC transporter ATP-binding protein, partial [Lachnospiraceae bacterium]|nr:ABC transporter ATP-binding protein [Lachnospiraceae bacterium]
MIEVKHLSKRYGNHLAVDDLTFTIENGKVYGFLGPNGAGKSTTMNIITGCLAATSGEVKIDGYDIFEQSTEAKKRIGYLPEIPPVYPDRTIREYLRFVAEAKGVKKADIRGQIDKVIEETKIRDYENRLIKNLSKGYRQSVGIAQALIGDPDVIILDEPTVGLDPMQITWMRELIRSLGREHTIILSSHILFEVNAVCDRVLIINHGKKIVIDTPENIIRTLGGTTGVRVVVNADQETFGKALATLGNVSQWNALEENFWKGKAEMQLNVK